jgi:CRAL/TRIO domain
MLQTEYQKKNSGVFSAVGFIACEGKPNSIRHKLFLTLKVKLRLREMSSAKFPSNEELASRMKQGFATATSQTKALMESSMKTVQKGVTSTVNVAQSGLKEVTYAAKTVKERTKSSIFSTPKAVSDRIEDSEEKALVALKEMVKEAKAAAVTSSLSSSTFLMPQQKSRPQIWNFATVPLDTFHKTLDDLFLAFLRWAKVNDGDSTNTQINVTRAMERLTSYALWMDQTGRDMIDPPLIIESIRRAWNAWHMKVSYDSAGHLVWWLDFSQIDWNQVKALPADENLRLFVWFAHFIMFDPQSQRNGCVLVPNLGKLPLWDSLNMLNPTLARKVDNLTIGTMPVKMKQVYICESPQWATTLLKMMKPFMSPIVKNRIKFLNNPKVLEDILGLDCIPRGFVNTDGKLEKDIVSAAFPLIS